MLNYRAKCEHACSKQFRALTGYFLAYRNKSKKFSTLNVVVHSSFFFFFFLLIRLRFKFWEYKQSKKTLFCGHIVKKTDIQVLKEGSFVSSGRKKLSARALWENQYTLFLRGLAGFSLYFLKGVFHVRKNSDAKNALKFRISSCFHIWRWFKLYNEWTWTASVKDST